MGQKQSNSIASQNKSIGTAAVDLVRRGGGACVAAGGACVAALEGAAYGVAAGGYVGVNLYWKSGTKYDVKGAKVSNMSLYVSDHDTMMSAMLCRLMYTLDGRLLKVTDTIDAYPTLDELQKKTGTSQLKVEAETDQWPVVLDVGELEVDTYLTAKAYAKYDELQVQDIGDLKEGEFLYIYNPSIVDMVMKRNEKVQIKSIDSETRKIKLHSVLKSNHPKRTRVYKTLKYIHIMYMDSKMYVEVLPDKFELVASREVDINSFIKTELGGQTTSLRRQWFLRSMFHPGGALSPSYCSVIAHDDHEARHGKVSNAASRHAGEPCKISLPVGTADKTHLRVTFEDGDSEWFKEDEITQAAFTICGASGGAEAANGAWYETGTQNGKPIYENGESGEGCVMKWEDGQRDSHDDSSAFQTLGNSGQEKWTVKRGDEYLFYHESDSVPPANDGWIRCAHASAISLDLKARAPAPVTLWVTWQGTMFDRRPMDIFTDLGAAPVKAGLWHAWFPDLWVHSAMYSKVQNDALGQNQMIMELVRAYDVKRIVFCGHSLGGGLARIAHVLARATFKSMPEQLQGHVNGVEVRSITWAAPMVLFEPERPETGMRLVPMPNQTEVPMNLEEFRQIREIQAEEEARKQWLQLRPETGRRLVRMPDQTEVPMNLEEFRQILEIQVAIQRKTGGGPAVVHVAEEARKQWVQFPEANKWDEMLSELKTQLLEESVNHIFDKDIVPQLPGNHQFFKPALQMAARSIIVQHCPVMEQPLAEAANDFASQAFSEGALANNFKELERFNHMCTVRVYTPAPAVFDVTSTETVPAVYDVTSAEKLPKWTEESDDSYQYLVTCHTTLPNNVVGCSALTCGTETNGAESNIIHVVSTHEWRNNDCLRICSKSAEEVQIKAIAKNKITLTKALQRDHAEGVEVRREPRRIADGSNPCNWGTYLGTLALGRVRREGILVYDSNTYDPQVSGKLFVGHFQNGQISDGLIMDDGKIKFTVKGGKRDDGVVDEIKEKYTGMWEKLDCLRKEHDQLQTELKDLNRLKGLSLEEVKTEARKIDVPESKLVDVDEQAVITLILQKKKHDEDLAKERRNTI